MIFIVKRIWLYFLRTGQRRNRGICGGGKLYFVTRYFLDLDLELSILKSSEESASDKKTLSDPLCKDGNAWFTAVSLEPFFADSPFKDNVTGNQIWLYLFLRRFGIHDEAEVIAVHGVGGLLGMVVLPLFRQDDLGLFYNGGLDAATGLGK